MSSNPDKTWHALLDEICLDQGHVDNVKLASDLCDLGKNAAPGAFDSALKSLAHWRDGKHTPTRRNFRLLTQILMIDDEPVRADEWRALYEQALRRKPSGEQASMETQPMRADGSSEAAVIPGRSSNFAARYAVMAGLVVVLGFGLLFSEAEPVRGGDDGRITTLPVDMTGQQIYYREIANLKVGESIVLHGKRGPSCGEPPPEWTDVLKYLPEPNTGVWSDGGVGFRVSRACGGPTPARAVVFTATQTGVDNFRLYDDPITITVK